MWGQSHVSTDRLAEEARSRRSKLLLFDKPARSTPYEAGLQRGVDAGNPRIRDSRLEIKKPMPISNLQSFSQGPRRRTRQYVEEPGGAQRNRHARLRRRRIRLGRNAALRAIPEMKHRLAIDIPIGKFYIYIMKLRTIIVPYERIPVVCAESMGVLFTCQTIEDNHER